MHSTAASSARLEMSYLFESRVICIALDKENHVHTMSMGSPMVITGHVRISSFNRRSRYDITYVEKVMAQMSRASVRPRDVVEVWFERERIEQTFLFRTVCN